MEELLRRQVEETEERNLAIKNLSKSVDKTNEQNSKKFKNIAEFIDNLSR
jgi:hypothetical protein